MNKAYVIQIPEGPQLIATQVDSFSGYAGQHCFTCEAIDLSPAARIAVRAAARANKECQIAEMATPTHYEPEYKVLRDMRADIDGFSLQHEIWESHTLDEIEVWVKNVATVYDTAPDAVSA